MLGKKLGKNVFFLMCFRSNQLFSLKWVAQPITFLIFSVFLENPLETEKKSQNRTFKNRVAGVLPLGVHRKHTNPKS